MAIPAAYISLPNWLNAHKVVFLAHKSMPSALYMPCGRIFTRSGLPSFMAGNISVFYTGEIDCENPYRYNHNVIFYDLFPCHRHILALRWRLYFCELFCCGDHDVGTTFIFRDPLWYCNLPPL